MELRRVVIRDRYPVLDRAVVTRPLNQAALAAALVSLAAQAWAIGIDLSGGGRPAGGFERFSFAFVALLWLGMGVLVFLQRRAVRAGQLFLLSSAAGATFVALGIGYTASLASAVLYAAGALLFPVLLVSFVRALDEKRGWTLHELWLYLPPLALLWPAAQGLAHGHATASWRLGVGLIGIYLPIAIALSLVALRRAGSPRQAAQFRALSVGLIAGTAPGIIAFVLPITTLGRLTVDIAWLPALILVFLIAVSYAVLLFELNDADLIVRRGLVYGALTLVAAAVYGTLGLVLAARGTVIVSPGGSIGFVAVTILLIATFGTIGRGTRQLADRLLYGSHSNRWDELRELSDRLGSVMEPSQLGQVLSTGVVSALRLRGACLLWREGDEFVGATSAPAEAKTCRLPAATIRSALGDPARSLLLIHARPLTPRRRRVVPERFRALDDLHTVLFLPLVTRSGLEAVLCLQPKVAHDAFGSDDFKFLLPLARQASVALDNALLLQRLQDNLRELQEAYARIAREQEVERARLARELHDGTSQELATIITLSSVLERQLEPGHPALHTLDRLLTQAKDTYQGVHRASHNLSPVLLGDLGLMHSLTRYTEQMRETSGMIVRCEVDDLGRLPDSVELALYRAAQECLENARKHSGAAAATLILHQVDGHIEMCVADEGRGMIDSSEPGLGLVAMRERVAAVGGTLRIESAPGIGTRVKVAIPL